MRTYKDQGLIKAAVVILGIELCLSATPLAAMDQPDDEDNDPSYNIQVSRPHAPSHGLGNQWAFDEYYQAHPELLPQAIKAFNTRSATQNILIKRDPDGAPVYEDQR